MKKFLIAAVVGGLLGIVIAPQLAGPLLAKETDQAKTYQLIHYPCTGRCCGKYKIQFSDAKFV